MEVLRGRDFFLQPISHPVVTIGNFDGLHVGHQKIIQLAIEKAKERKGSCIVYTFRPHPQVALKPGTPLALLLTYDEKLEFLSALGVDVTIEEPFNREFSTLEPERFFYEVILRRLKAEVIVVGYDFAFGRERHGHLEALETFCRDTQVKLHVVPPQTLNGEVVSSSCIRKQLLSGNVDWSRRLLGKPFFYRGIVVKGQGRGRQLGFPTANLKLENKLALPFGVYATWAIYEGTRYLSVTNVGVRPTFFETSGLDPQEGLPVWVETHFLDFHRDLYGSQVEVQFLSRLRDERKFSNIEALKGQIAIDIQMAKKILSDDLKRSS